MRGPSRPSGDSAGILDALRQLAEGLQGLSGHGQRSIEIGGKEGRMAFGYTIRTADGRTEAHGQPTPAAVREPIIDVIEESDAILVIAEMPGVTPAALSARLNGQVLLLDAAQWQKRIPLPAAVREAEMRITARNGIVEIHLPRLDLA